MIHVFGKGAFGRPERSSLIQTDGTQSLAIELGHKSPVPTDVMYAVYAPFSPGVLLDPFCGSGSSLIAAAKLDGRAIGIEIEEKYCEIAAKRLSQEVLEFEPR
jgi:site-specific DNA-methyltransferase (adenine-specific)